MSGTRRVLRPGRLVRFDGRARRAEYWGIVLALAVALGLAVLLDVRSSEGGYSATTFVTVLGVVIGPAATSRRLHDRGRRGWWMLVAGAGPAALAALSLPIAMGEATAEDLIGPGLSIALTLVLLVSGAALLWLLVELARPGTAGANRFGPPPGPEWVEEPPAP
ncbi:DUF805 domain-containing protein [Salipiger bermudensis]|uniref:DUF805 domain-containing protein n=1 Tax=Salipiger bermudensis TaxID=344736 RepID=UPI001CD42548|nr:DUF805 domain-containing protein [Salipiger bermudensis]MCA0961786.1 DUF805 domain-containing protein [Salipiger bermudensis]